MNIGIIGSRRRDTDSDQKLTELALLKLLENPKSDTESFIITSGGCPKGGDRFAEVLAKRYNIPIKLYRADWAQYGKSAGFKRNIFIAQDADVLIACVSSDRTGGTEDTIRKYLALGKKELILV